MAGQPEMKEKAELFSREWVELARTCLEEQVAQGAVALYGVKFAACMIATDPPAHLALGGTNRVSWHFVVDGPTVRVGRGEIDCAFKAEVDYQTVLPAARTPYSDNPEVYAAIRREQQASLGLPEPPAPLSPILHRLHNFLARRTA